MDSRITEALKTIGSLVEADMNADECNQLITQLVNMKEFVYYSKWSEVFRLDGKINLALNSEKEADKLYHGLPEEIKW